MDGPHDLGGVPGFGPVRFSPDDPLFGADWERKVFGLTMAASTIGLFNRDENRHARERMSPEAYRSSGYFEQWLVALETNLTELGVLDADVLRDRVSDPGEIRGKPRPELFELFQDTLEFGASLDRTVAAPPLFEVGSRVRAVSVVRPGHTRLPAYVRGHVGVVRRVDPAFVLPDTNAHHDGENPEHTYSVGFSALDLWGKGDHEVRVDVWESYLEEPGEGS
ncbi:nitrile hydratase [Lentzea sp. NBRC 105346]|uniref:nitrile hydratase subunit beta n=1 Tax=Lentzea sp. NBRC 105346 TaxID=3032205 RepID=UPI0024A0D3C0|nr:nitrile hydratase subunit beta [Lentzea sp. NBRC 105346]GLZ35178.1 nitrile hydratase [Lentzea sp. NBRC 105346]